MSTMNNDGPQPPRKQRRRSTAQEVLSKRRNELDKPINSHPMIASKGVKFSNIITFHLFYEGR